MNIVLVAEEAAGVHVLKLLLRRGTAPASVLTASERARGTTVAGVAAEAGVEVRSPDIVRDPAFALELREAGTDLLLNVHSLRIAHGAVVEEPRLGSFNVHPGPLPAYGGLNTPSWAIAAGEIRHAVTVHRMTAAVDAGPIAYESWFDVAPADTGLRVATRCAREGIALVERLLEDAARDAIPVIEQRTEGGHWYPAGPPHGGRVPWSLGARVVADVIRAADYAPFPSPWGAFATTVDGAELEILAVERTGEAADAAAGTVGADGRVSAGDEWVRVTRLRAGGAAVEPAIALAHGAICR